jgi:3-deoxy-manno-octulosonate cytidylyltransferase (CMP-KDO synthetase)
MMAERKIERGAAAVVVIPVRYASTRLPGKPLLKDTGKYLVQHACEAASKSVRASRVIVATDDKRIYEAVREFGGEAVMTSVKHPSGTDRIAEAVRDIDCEIVINVQGDEPELPAAYIDRLIGMFDKDADMQMATLAVPVAYADAAVSPNAVKVVVDMRGDALYFSRAPIPYHRDGVPEGQTALLKHLGIYGYRKKFLGRFVSWPQSRLERIERLEQLRALENGVRIRVGVVDADTIGIDTREDYEKFVRKYLSSTDKRPKTGIHLREPK